MPAPEIGSPPELRHNPAYRLLMTGRTLALMGASMTGLAGMLLGYDLTHDSAMAGTIMGLAMVGMLLTTLPAGVLADRVDRKKVMITAALGHAMLLASIPVPDAFGVLTVAQLAVVTFAAGAVSVCYAPAEQAALKQIVAPADLGTAMAVNQARFSFAAITGPPLAGALYSLGRTLPYVGDCVANLIAAACAAAVRDDLRPPRREQQTRLLSDLTAGLRFLFTLYRSKSHRAWSGPEVIGIMARRTLSGTQTEHCSDCTFLKSSSSTAMPPDLQR